MSKKLNTTGDLRRLLADAIVSVKDGTMEAAKANDIAKLAGRLNDNFFAEVAVARSIRESGETPTKLGAVPLSGDVESPAAAP